MIVIADIKLYITVFRTPNGIRTRAATLKGWCPRPLDDGGLFDSTRERCKTIRELANFPPIHLSTYRSF